MTSYIGRPTPQERRAMDIRANILTRKCDGCGTPNHHRNLVETKAGDRLCAACLDAAFTAFLEEVAR